MKPVELRGHDRQITVVKFNLDGDLLFTGGADKKVCLYDVFTQEKLGSYTTSASVKSLDVDQNSEILMVGNFNGHLEFYEVTTGVKIGRFQREWKIKHVEFIKGNKQFLVCYEQMGVAKKSEICIFDIKTVLDLLKATESNIVTFEEEVYTDDEPKSTNQTYLKPGQTITLESQVTKISFGFLNKYLIATTACGKIHQLDTKGNIVLTEQANDGECKGFNMAKDYSMVATCGQDGVRFFDPETLKLIRTFKTEVPMNTVAISPLCCLDGDVRLHQLMAGGIPAREAAMSKKGGFEIHLCNIMYEKEIGTIAGSFSPINSIEFMPDGKGFACGAEEGVCKIIKFDKSYFELYK